jgi:hypothetical protein
MIARLPLAAVLALLAPVPALALPPLPKYVEQHYAASPEYAKFAETLKGLKTKCDACHKPGADKKAKGHGLNDYGHAVHEHLNDKEFMAAHKAAADNPESEKKALELAAAALKAAEADKNAQGQTYGELIKAGKLPGTN